MKDAKMVFGDAVRRRRLELGLSQEQLADKSGLHRTYIGDIERGHRNISLKSITLLIDALELSPGRFFSEYYDKGTP
jgi:transcriptional regulator with XRE-family HTH domain